jgi:hypothetical protein
LLFFCVSTIFSLRSPIEIDCDTLRLVVISVVSFKTAYMSEMAASKNTAKRVNIFHAVYEEENSRVPAPSTSGSTLAKRSESTIASHEIFEGCIVFVSCILGVASRACVIRVLAGETM